MAYDVELFSPQKSEEHNIAIMIINKKTILFDFFASIFLSLYQDNIINKKNKKTILNKFFIFFYFLPIFIVDKKKLKLYTKNMEITELDLEIAENQIAIDFDGLEKAEEEKSVCLPQSLVKSVNFDWIKEEVLFVVVRANRKDVCSNFSSLKLCGKTMTEWVLMAGGQCEKKVLEDDQDILSKIRAITTDKKIIAVFYSDTPLLDKNAFYRIMDYFSSRSINFLQLSRGLIVKRDFLLNNPSFMSSATGGYEDESLLVADSGRTLSFMHKYLNKKIVNFHIENGVVILGENTVFIDADCEIESGVVIYPNNIIKGQSVISAGCVLESGNIITNSILFPNVKCASCCIENSKIGQGNVIKTGQTIINEER